MVRLAKPPPPRLAAPATASSSSSSAAPAVPPPAYTVNSSPNASSSNPPGYSLFENYRPGEKSAPTEPIPEPRVVEEARPQRERQRQAQRAPQRGRRQARDEAAVGDAVRGVQRRAETKPGEQCLAGLTLMAISALGLFFIFWMMSRPSPESEGVEERSVSTVMLF
ncbi:uncharacterized protein LTR77_007260 [Saxophila tyrrhenica]|uniref:Uncharacterized protein n=1 Tax=Saxophila tyrrhenica TaxID=1690608 RepID=A0AAV9P481_9PEZI|nr:hypothetical protein LTR77_007260 [Saxophila tyrrhenica]